MDVASSTASTYAVLSLLQSLTSLGLTEYMWPRDKSVVTDNCDADFIIVGGGTTGSIIANRLTQDENVKVAVLEAGGDPPIESVFPGLLNYLPHTLQDYNFTSQDDGRTARGQKDGTILALAGKVLGGSSSVDHLLFVRGCPADFDEWAVAANDESWGFDGLYKYFIDLQNVKDSEIMNSSLSQYHGSKGYLEVTREPQDVINPYLAAFEEIGKKSILDLSTNNSIGYAQPLLSISGLRSSSAYAFLRPIKNRSNLYVFKNHVVTEIIFNGTTATGVKAINKNNKEVICKASKEVIVTAGTFNTAKLLMLSGVGPKTHLENLGIEVVADLPVGQTLFDHATVSMFFKMEASQDLTPQFDPTQFPVPSFVGQVAIDENQSCADYQALGVVSFHDSTGFIPLCSHVKNFNDDVCQTVFEANQGHNVLWVFLSNLHPKSAGKVLLQSTDPDDAPLIYTQAYTVEEDLSNTLKYVKDFNNVLNSTYFKNVSAEFIKLPLSQCESLEYMSDEYYECYILSMGSTLFHYCGTCPLGSVVGSDFRVIGLNNLTVADASIIPKIVGSNIKEGVNAIAAKAADVIKNTYGLN